MVASELAELTVLLTAAGHGLSGSCLCTEQHAHQQDASRLTRLSLVDVGTPPHLGYLLFCLLNEAE